MLLGTPDYLAPDQAAIRARIDIRADIYSLGCALYHLLAGQPPFPDKACSSRLSGTPPSAKPAGTTRPFPMAWSRSSRG